MRTATQLMALSLFCGMFAAATPAHAGPTYRFSDITLSNVLDAAIGEAQLLMEVVPDMDPAKVEFHFMNTGPWASSLTQVYFDGSALLSPAAIINGPGVQFSAPAVPTNLPGGASITPPFDATAEFSAGSDAPVQPNGVNPGEELRIVFDLRHGATYADILDELARADLRVGIHVQGFASGGSQSFINDPAAIPVPGAVLLGTLGAALVGCLRRRGAL